MLRHTGTIQNTGSRIIVAFMQLPEAPQRCLVIQTDSLPEYYKEIVNRLVQSDEGQAAVDFAHVLGRHKVEGQNKDLLTLLHQTGNLIPLPIDNVVMTPIPSMSIPLRQVLQQLGRQVPNSSTQAQSDQYSEPKRFNQFEENQQADLDNNRAMMARSKLQQASLLEEDARRYREEAYAMVPSLRPMTTSKAEQPKEKAKADYNEQVSEMSAIASSDKQLNLFPEDNPNA